MPDKQIEAQYNWSFREIKLKPLGHIISPHTQMLKTRKTDNTSVGEDVQLLKSSPFVGRSITWYITSLENIWIVSYKYMLVWSSISTSRYRTSKRNEKSVHKKMNIHTFLFSRVSYWKQFKCPSTGEQINKYSHNNGILK